MKLILSLVFSFLSINVVAQSNPSGSTSPAMNDIDDNLETKRPLVPKTKEKKERIQSPQESNAQYMEENEFDYKKRRDGSPSTSPANPSP